MGRLACSAEWALSSFLPAHRRSSSASRSPGLTSSSRYGYSPLKWLKIDSTHAWSFGVAGSPEVLHDARTGHEHRRRWRSSATPCLTPPAASGSAVIVRNDTVGEFVQQRLVEQVLITVVDKSRVNAASTYVDSDHASRADRRSA